MVLNVFPEKETVCPAPREAENGLEHPRNLVWRDTTLTVHDMKMCVKRVPGLGDLRAACSLFILANIIFAIPQS